MLLHSSTYPQSYGARNRDGVLFQELLQGGDLRLKPGDLFAFISRYRKRRIETVNFGVEAAFAGGERDIQKVAVLLEFADLAQARA